jgi:hypothetical protein
VPLLNYALAFALQLRKSTENLRAAEQPQDYSLRQLGCLLRDSLGWAAARQFNSVTGGLQSALGRRKCLPSCRTKGFPASANCESKLLISALMWSAKNGIPKSW